MLVVMVLLQQGKGADAGAAFGGGSNTLFGATGATSLIVKITTGLAVAFMATSVLLIREYQGGAFTGDGPREVGSPFKTEAAQPLKVQELPVAAPETGAATNPANPAEANSALPVDKNNAAVAVTAPVTEEHSKEAQAKEAPAPAAKAVTKSESAKKANKQEEKKKAP